MISEGPRTSWQYLMSDGDFTKWELTPKDSKRADWVGFIYMVIIDGQFYIGQKARYSFTKSAPTVKAKKARKEAKISGLPPKRYRIKESKWQDYQTSSDDVHKLLADGHKARWLVLQLIWKPLEWDSMIGENGYVVDDPAEWGYRKSFSKAALQYEEAKHILATNATLLGLNHGVSYKCLSWPKSVTRDWMMEHITKEI